jgi:hypothetical protein
LWDFLAEVENHVTDELNEIIQYIILTRTQEQPRVMEAGDPKQLEYTAILESIEGFRKLLMLDLCLPLLTLLGAPQRRHRFTTTGVQVLKPPGFSSGPF